MTTDLGTFTVRALDPLADAKMVHGWVTHPKASFWLMGDARLQDVEREYMAIAAHPHHDAFIGLHDGEPAFLMERYDPPRWSSRACTRPNPATSVCTSWSPRPTLHCTASPAA